MLITDRFLSQLVSVNGFRRAAWGADESINSLIIALEPHVTALLGSYGLAAVGAAKGLQRLFRRLYLK